MPCPVTLRFSTVKSSNRSTGPSAKLSVEWIQRPPRPNARSPWLSAVARLSKVTSRMASAFSLGGKRQRSSRSAKIRVTAAIKCLRAILGDQHMAPFPSKPFRDDSAQVRLVIDKQYGGVFQLHFRAP